MQTSATSQGFELERSLKSSLTRKSANGFTLVELMVVLAIAAVMVGVVLPRGARMFETMQYRDAVRQLQQAASSARFQAITKGSAMDLVLEPAAARYLVKQADQGMDDVDMSALDADLRFAATTAGEVSPGLGLAAIRFYPHGGSTGGSMSVQRTNGSGVRLRVDWLLGRVSQEPLSPP